MAITKNGSWATQQTTTKSTTLSHTLGSGTNRVVLIFATFKTNTNVATTQILSTGSSTTSPPYNANYQQSGQFRISYDSGGDNIDATLLYTTNILDTSNNPLGFTSVFAVWEDDLPATTGSKTVFIDSNRSDVILSHIGVIQYDGVLQGVFYADRHLTSSTSTSHTLDFNTKVANCLLLNSVAVDDEGGTETSLTDNSSQTEETAFTFDATNDLSGAIYSKSLTGTGDDSVSYTLGTARGVAITGIILIPDTETITSAEVIKVRDWNIQNQVSQSSADPSVTITLPSGNDRIVLALMYWDDTGNHTIDTATFGGQSMTHIGQVGNTSQDVYASAWYLLEANLPADGSRTLTITNPSTLDNWTATVIILENVEQEAPNGLVSNSVQGTTLALGSTTPDLEHSLVCSVFGVGDDVAKSHLYEGMSIYNMEDIDTAESGSLQLTFLAHDRAINPTLYNINSEPCAGLAFWVKPKVITSQTLTVPYIIVSDVYYEPDLDQNLSGTEATFTPVFYSSSVELNLSPSLVTFNPVFFAVEDLDQNISPGLISFNPVFYGGDLDLNQFLEPGLVTFSPNYFEPDLDQQVSTTSNSFSPNYFEPDLDQYLTSTLTTFTPSYLEPDLDQQVSSGLVSFTPVFYSVLVQFSGGEQNLAPPFVTFSPNYFAPDLDQSVSPGIVTFTPGYFEFDLDQFIDPVLTTFTPTVYEFDLDQEMEVGVYVEIPNYFEPDLDQQVSTTFNSFTPSYFGFDVDQNLTSQLVTITPNYLEPDLDQNISPDLSVFSFVVYGGSIGVVIKLFPSLVQFIPDYFIPDLDQQISPGISTFNSVFYEADFGEDFLLITENSTGFNLISENTDEDFVLIN